MEEDKISFWKDKEKGIVKDKLFSETAKRWAEGINKKATSKTNNISQLRKFYDEVISFDSRLQGSQEKDEFEKLLPYIKMLNAKAAYAKARDLISDEFVDFIKKSISLVSDRKDFDVLKTFFEAFMGYYKYEEEKKKQGGRR